uniref:Uncharacterized protein n=1 Tax=Setaria viridis TaxID=4556 RepID=A0A4U6T3H0_SETVI|nr:hypothetical protein SEVIR_9G410350v2 [Setaria viridis]
MHACSCRRRRQRNGDRGRRRRWRRFRQGTRVVERWRGRVRGSENARRRQPPTLRRRRPLGSPRAPVAQPHARTPPLQAKSNTTC